ncbi:phosphohydrolase [Xanthomonas phage RTH11]|nr:phosphohydrolase [Xanthomonas phage RTH11]
MSKVLCLYHSDCFDGLGAAWALFKRFPDAEFVAVRYNEPSPAVAGRIVYVVDFCYPFDELLEMASVAEELHVFDHHKGMSDTIESFNHALQAWGFDQAKYRGVFAQDRSGAKLTWELLMPEYPVPLILEHISDRDLWTFDLDDTKSITAGLGTYEMSLTTWDRLFRWSPEESSNDHDSPHQAALDQLDSEGRPILRKMKQDINRIRSLCERTIELGGYTVPLINAPRPLISEILEEACLDKPFAVGYFDGPDYREYSMRSTKNVGINLIALAQSLGGNGHAHAAGFRVSRDHPLAQI